MKKRNQDTLNKMFDLISESADLPHELKNEIKVLLSKQFRTEKNFFLLTDFYKQTHWMQYPHGTSEIYSYYENRKSEFPKQLWFGLSYIIQEYLEGEVVEQWMIDEAQKDTNTQGGFEYFNKMGAQRIIDVHNGRLPLEIKSVDEGTLVPTSNVLMTICNTDPELPYLTNYVEDILMHVYSTVGTATLSFYIRKLAEKYGKRTGAIIHPFYLNDFGFRSASSVETAEKNGGAHLMVFEGSDNQSANKWLRDFYGAENILQSVFASEHSTTTIRGRAGEKEAVKEWLLKAPDAATLSIVIDSYDYKKFITDVMGNPEIKALILARSGKTVARPDSGIPHIVSVQVLQLLAATFGFTVNDNGYYVLNPKVGMIYADGINYHSINGILHNVVEAGYCVSNLIFGMGGALIQEIDRDTNGVAIKCSSAIINGVKVEVFKDPIDSSKKSKKGELKLHESLGSFHTYSSCDSDDINFKRLVDSLKVVFKNGEHLNKPSYGEIKARIEGYVLVEPAEYYDVKTV